MINNKEQNNNNGEKVTINQLARMVKEGFERMNKGFEEAKKGREEIKEKR